MSSKPPEERTHIRPYMTCDPRELVVDWTKNVSRSGREPEIDDDLKQLAMSMRPKNQGGNGQLQPVIVRPLPDRRLQLISGYRRTQAARYLIESGECQDFQIQCVVRRLSDAEAAVSNLSENLDRKDISAVELAHAVRSLFEDYGMSIPEIATRLNRTEAWLLKIQDLTMLPKPIQESIANGHTTITAGLEIASVPPQEQMTVFREAISEDGKVKASAVKEAKRERHESDGQGGPIPRGLKHIKTLLAEVSGKGESAASRKLAKGLENYLAGKLTDVQIIDLWRKTLAD